MALDYGKKRIGVAVSDPLGISAQPAETIQRTGKPEDLEEIGRLADQYDVGTIVVGLPRRTDGTEGPEAARVRQFIDALRDKVAVPIETWDEWFTTAEAERSLIEGGARRAERKEVIDSVAASLILQGWLRAHQEADECAE